VTRWYSPALGRFLSVDPKSGNTSTPQSLDRYSYISGNPLGGVDPFGTCNYNRDTGQCVNASTQAAPVFDYHSIVIKVPARPVNKCLESNFHAYGCTSGPDIWVGNTQSKTCISTHGHAGCGGLVSSASKELVEASNYVVTQAALHRAQWAAEDAAAAKELAISKAKYNIEHVFDGVLVDNKAGGCDNPISCLAGGIGNVANGVNQAWQHTGGAVVNSIAESDALKAAIAVAIPLVLGGICLYATIQTMGAAGLICASFMGSALMLGGDAAGQYVEGKPIDTTSLLVSSTVGALTGPLLSKFPLVVRPFMNGVRPLQNLLIAGGANAFRYTATRTVEGKSVDGRCVFAAGFLGAVGQGAGPLAKYLGQAGNAVPVGLAFNGVTSGCNYDK
jgi:hypothetical protein